MSKFKKLVSQPLFLPIFCMILVMAVNIIYDVMAGNFAFNFFTISIRNGVLYGRIIDILNRGSEIAILAIGMTLVVSCSAGTDISVGSVMSLAASFCCMLLAGYGVSSTNSLAAPLIVGVLGGILMGCASGAFNGFLVSYLNVQPMVATLILFSAARAIGLLLCNNMIVYVRDDSFKIFGGYLGFMPTPIVVAIVCILITSHWAYISRASASIRRLPASRASIPSASFSCAMLSADCVQELPALLLPPGSALRIPTTSD